MKQDVKMNPRKMKLYAGTSQKPLGSTPMNKVVKISKKVKK
jgi:hypothetical protein